MEEKKFSLVFKGDIAQGSDVNDVKNKLCALFKTDISKIETLFTGKAKILKKDISEDEAFRFKVSFEKTGAIAIVEPVREEKPAATTDYEDKQLIACPKCNMQQKVADSCVRCGVVFSKIKSSAVGNAPDPSQNSMSPPPVKTESIAPRYIGVRGWLLFFCISLTVLGPLATISAFIVAFRDVSQLFSKFPGLLVIMYIDVFLSLGLMTLSVYAGIGLLRIRPGAVLMAKRYLFCFLIYQAISSVLPFMAGLPPAANEAMYADVGRDLFRAVVFFAIWYSYLNKSQRVRATYAS